MTAQQKRLKWTEQGVLYELPEGWALTSLEESFDIVLGQSPPSSTYNLNGSGLPFYQGKSEFGNLYPTPQKWCIAPKKISERGDVLISVRAPVGPTNICSEKSCIGRGLAAIRPLGGIETFFTLYLMRAFENIIAGKGTGTTFSAITGDKLKKFHAPIPPLPEQRAIVSKIEQLFSDLDNGMENFKKAKEQLKIYRQAVLKKAFEGELTRKWREERTDLPSVEELLQQIKEEQEKHYQKQLGGWEKAVKDWENIGKEGKKPSRPKKPKEPQPLSKEELDELPELPRGGVWSRLGQIIEEPKYGTSKKCSYDVDGKAVLRIPNVGNGVIDKEDLKFASFSEEENKIYKLKGGDILTIRSNGSIALVGKCALIHKQDEDFLYAGYLIRLRPLSIIDSKYLLNCLSSICLRNQIQSKAKSTSGVNNINSGEIKSLIMPICSLQEQQQIAEEIETRLSICDKMEATIAESLQKSESLRQSILKKAFEGKLLNEKELEEARNAPDWEPAEKLVERIRQERQIRENNNKPTRRKTHG
jgi:type I restriction enzyme S subunit